MPKVSALRPEKAREGEAVSGTGVGMLNDLLLDV